MAKATVTKTPSQEIIDTAKQEVEVQAPSGKTYTLRKFDIVAQFWLLDAVGPTTSKNEVFMMMALPLLFISKIDGEPVMMVKTRLQFDALLTKVGSDWNWLTDAVDEAFAIDTPADPEQTLKN